MISHNVFGFVPNGVSCLLKPHVNYIAYKSRGHLDSWRLNHVGADEGEDNHHQINEVGGDWDAIFAAAEGGHHHEDGDPDDYLHAHEHADRTAEQRNETSPIWLL